MELGLPICEILMKDTYISKSWVQKLREMSTDKYSTKPKTKHYRFALQHCNEFIDDKN